MRSLSGIIRDNSKLEAVAAKHGIKVLYPGIGTQAFKEAQAKPEPVKYTGHDPVHLGLQSHSIGSEYPWTVQGRGAGYQAAHLLNGTESPIYDRCAHAQKALEVFKAEGRWIDQDEAVALTGVSGPYVPPVAH